MNTQDRIFHERFWQPLNDHVLATLSKSERQRAGRVATRIQKHIESLAAVGENESAARKYIERQLEAELSTWTEFERTVSAANLHMSATLKTVAKAAGGAGLIALQVAANVAVNSLANAAQAKLNGL